MRVSTQPRWGRASCVARGRSPTGPITELGDTRPGDPLLLSRTMPRRHMHEWLRVKDAGRRNGEEKGPCDPPDGQDEMNSGFSN